MNIYEAPRATLVEIEVDRIITVSEPFDFLLTWGSKIGEAKSDELDFYK